MKDMFQYSCLNYNTISNPFSPAFNSFHTGTRLTPTAYRRALDAEFPEFIFSRENRPINHIWWYQWICIGLRIKYFFTGYF